MCKVPPSVTCKNLHRSTDIWRWMSYRRTNELGFGKHIHQYGWILISKRRTTSTCHDLAFIGTCMEVIPETKIWCWAIIKVSESSVPVVSRPWLWPGNTAFFEEASMLWWWIMVFFSRCNTYFYGTLFPMSYCRSLIYTGMCHPGIPSMPHTGHTGSKSWSCHTWYPRSWL